MSIADGPRAHDRLRLGGQRGLHHEVVKDYLAAVITPTLTGEFFPNFMEPREQAMLVHGESRQSATVSR